MNTELPKDPMMLLSVINLKLRDFYPSLDELCSDMGIDEDELCTKLLSIEYEYDKSLNKFV